MSDRTILWATDFSASSEKALAGTGSSARDLGATLVVPHVEPGRPTTEFGSDSSPSGSAFLPN